MEDFDIEDYKIKTTQMTYGDAIDGLENIIKSIEDSGKNHFLLKIARQLLDDAKKQDKNKQADFATVDFVENFGSPEMMSQLESIGDFDCTAGTYGLSEKNFGERCREEIKKCLKLK